MRSPFSKGLSDSYSWMIAIMAFEFIWQGQGFWSSFLAMAVTWIVDRPERLIGSGLPKHKWREPASRGGKIELTSIGTIGLRNHFESIVVIQHGSTYPQPRPTAHLVGWAAEDVDKSLSSALRNDWSGAKTKFFALQTTQAKNQFMRSKNVRTDLSGFPCLDLSGWSRDHTGEECGSKTPTLFFWEAGNK